MCLNFVADKDCINQYHFEISIRKKPNRMATLEKNDHFHFQRAQPTTPITIMKSTDDKLILSFTPKTVK